MDGDINRTFTAAAQRGQTAFLHLAHSHSHCLTFTSHCIYLHLHLYHPTFSSLQLNTVTGAFTFTFAGFPPQTIFFHTRTVTLFTI